MTTKQAREAIARLAAGTAVGHANPELADWEGTVTPNRNGRMVDLGRYVRVIWHTGTGGDGQPLSPEPGWTDATALTLKGECPGCARPAHFVSAGNDWDRAGGWRHDERVDAYTCWAGKAAFEAGRAGRPAAPAHPDSAAILAALPLRPRPGLCVDPGQDETGHLVVLDRADDPEEGDGIIGLAILGEDGWYLGCITCEQEIEEADSGMCRSCRQDAEWHETACTQEGSQP